jgi:hypothetical protein
MRPTLKTATGAAALSLLMGTTALAENLKIGVVVTLSGPPAALGQQIVDGNLPWMRKAACWVGRRSSLSLRTTS